MAADDKIQASLNELAARLGQLENITNGYRNYVNFNSDAIRDLTAQFNSVKDNQVKLQEQVTHGAASAGTSAQTAGTGTNDTPTGSGTYQVTTDTNFTIPVLYGQAQVRGAVFDAALTNSNANLVSAIVLTEVTGGNSLSGNADYTLNHVYFNDTLLNLHANGRVANAILNDGTETDKYNENTIVRLYEQKSWNAISNIQPGVAPSYGTAASYIPHWNDISHLVEGTLFAVIDQKYDAANGVQGIGTWTFDVTNDTAGTNPGDIVYDYLTNERYGAGYPANSVNDTSFVGNTVSSLKSISNTEFLYTTTIAADANMSAVTQIETTGEVENMTNISLFESANVTTLTGNLMAAGNVGGVDASNYSRLKIFWSYTNTNPVNPPVNPLFSNNTLIGFLDIARAEPDGANTTLYPGNTDPTYGEPVYQPNTEIVNFLVEGDRIRPEGSRYIYTVAANVTVPNPGYESFEIPVKERVRFPDLDDYANANSAYNTVGSDPTTAWTQDPDFNLVTYAETWPFLGASSSWGGDYYANLAFSNCLVGNAVFEGQSESLGGNTYIGTEPKARINGLLDTSRSVRDNISELMKHSFAELTYDNREGQWMAVPNGNADTANAFVFNETNILSELTVATSDVANFFNASRATYVEKTHNSVTEDVIVYTPETDKNANETTYMMEMDYPLTVSGSEATRKADERLRQNRKDLVIEFVADYSAIVVDPGDLVKVTVDSYGFEDKLFKVVKNEHSMEGDIISCRLAMMEWDLGVFTPRIPFRKPVLDDIEFEPEQYDDLVDAGGIDPETYPANSISGNAIVDGSIDACAKIDPTSWCANSVPGNAIIDDSVDTGQIADGAITPDKLSFVAPTINGIALNSAYSRARGTSIPIVGPSADDYPYINFYAPTDGIYTFVFSFIQPFGAQDFEYTWSDSNHYHPMTLGDSAANTFVEVGGTRYYTTGRTGTENITNPDSPAGNIVFRTGMNRGSPYLESGETDVYRVTANRARTNVSVKFYHVDSPLTIKDKTYRVRTYAPSAGTVQLAFSLNLAGGTFANVYNWSADYEDPGGPSNQADWSLPNDFGANATNIAGNTTSERAPFYNTEPNVYVIAPMVQMYSQGNITLG